MRRTTPQPSTSIPPVAIIYRDGLRLLFPRHSVGDEEVKLSTAQDKVNKEDNREMVNVSKNSLKSFILETE